MKSNKSCNSLKIAISHGRGCNYEAANLCSKMQKVKVASEPDHSHQRAASAADPAPRLDETHMSTLDGYFYLGKFYFPFFPYQKNFRKPYELLQTCREHLTLKVCTRKVKMSTASRQYAYFLCFCDVLETHDLQKQTRPLQPNRILHDFRHAPKTYFPQRHRQT